ncbi:RNA-directed DNA polymerase (reverse transcriptase)-related family protein [Thalictrum thalictroides]|uniref:RNA-directed DNA polymerase (Reverse transcriptase)-related family protein n=1 Tax=Thalictrum thalictroides TaxID=46969 RepID=A0A7J6W3G5_THATH|nr:RNA-directed DNA polymerase (reverse transcriptase)-related family protein [Thalictrum thalictroides]
MDIPADCSWSWRGILSLRGRAKSFTRHLIFDGSKTNFWYSPWSERGILHEQMSGPAKYLTGIRETTMMSDFIDHNSWKPPPNSNPLVIDLWQSLQRVEIGEGEEEDTVVWTPSPNGKFTIKSAYAVLRTRYPKAKWAKAIWGNPMIPRHSFITWLAAKERLSTQDKLMKWGSLQKSVCALCTDLTTRDQLLQSGSCYGMSNYFKVQWHNHDLPPICNRNHYSQVAASGIGTPYSSTTKPQENHWHIWFDCRFSTMVWKEVLCWCGIQRDPMDAVSEWTWISTTMKGGTLSANLIRIAMCATVYELWHERNNRIFAQKYCSRSQVIATIKHEVQLRFVNMKINATDTVSNRMVSSLVQAQVHILPKNPVSCSWEPPDRDFIMLNTDGSISPEGNSYAGILRDANGDVLMTYSANSKGCTIGYVEIQAIQVGLQLCKDLGLKRIQVRSDSKEAVDCITGTTQATWRSKQLTSKIKALQSSFEDIQIKHIFREMNSAADWLAKHKSPNEFCMYASNPLPRELYVIICKDKGGHLYQRS